MDAGPASDDRVVVGVVGKPFGVRGEVYVRPDPDIGCAFAPGEAYQVVRTDGGVATADASGGQLVVAESREHRGRRLVRFDGVDGPEAAEAVRGAILTVERADVALDPDAFWVDDLVGREVVDERGGSVGRVVDVTDGAAHDYLVVEGPHGEALVPAHADMVGIEGDRVVLRAPPGLVAADEAEEA